MKLTASQVQNIIQKGTPIHLHLGCGFNKLENHINIDAVERFEPDFTHDLSSPLPFPRESVDSIFANDLFEHFDKYLRFVVMQNWSQILKVGGKIKIQVPNIDHILSKYGKENIENLMELIFGEPMIASKSYTWHFGTHKWGYTVETLKKFGERFGIEFTILNAKANILAEGTKTKHVEINENEFLIYSFGNDKGIGKSHMSLKEVKFEMRKILPDIQ